MRVPARKQAARRNMGPVRMQARGTRLDRRDRSMGRRAVSYAALVCTIPRQHPCQSVNMHFVCTRVWTRSAPEGDDGGQSEGRGVVAGKFVVAGGDTSEVLQAVEGRLDPPALPIAALVVADLPLAAALAWG